MANISRHFVLGRMNKDIDERLLNQGEYINGLNIRITSTQQSEVGLVSNTRGNEQLTTLMYNGSALSDDARTIGQYADSSNETIYWFVHDPDNPETGGVLDMIVSLNVSTNLLQYHVVSTSVLNFDPSYLITGINLVDSQYLFWTDDYNPPRKINVRRNYPDPIAHVDQITDEDINVIVAPPDESPTITLTSLTGGQNFLDTVFLSFAYRYKYEDGEYSAMSQFSNVAFQPGPFELDPATYLNEGMVNRFNAVKVEFNTGDSNVVGLDICFKYGDDTTIQVIEKFVKSTQGWTDNDTQSIVFANSKIYTVLQDSEILRLYDNVPHRAKAQTIMGKRLMYGNYVDGYDLIDSDGASVNLQYTTELETTSLNVTNLTTAQSDGDYTLDGAAGTLSITDSVVTITFPSGTTISKGSFVYLVINCAHADFSGSDDPGDAAEQTPFSVQLFFTAQRDYDSVYDLASSDEFQEQVGVLSSQIQTMANSCNGAAMADTYNCVLEAPDGWDKYDSGINTGNQGFIVTTSPGSNDISIQILAIQYSNNATPAVNQFFEYFTISSSSAFFQELGDARSLHSNWDYEVAIVYMDDYKRSTTALVSTNNTVFVPPGNSITKNYLRTRIPIAMKPPSWATKYKFVVRSSREYYETIFTNIFYRDPIDGSVWFKLDGENQRKVSAGDTLIVKRDTDGPTDQYIQAVVLDKEAKERDFIPLNFQADGTTEIVELAGAYMRMKPNSFSANTPENPVLGGETLVDRDRHPFTSDEVGAYLEYPLYNEEDDGSYTRWDIPATSVVQLYIRMRRKNPGYSSGCDETDHRIDLTIVASRDYTNFKEFWEGENINVELGSTTGDDTNTYYSELYDKNGPSGTWYTGTFVEGDNQYQFVEDSATNQLWLTLRNGQRTCWYGTNPGWSIAKARITITRADSLLVFETVPSESTPGVFWEGSQCYDIIGGYHQGNVQNQTAGQEGIIDLDFFNCYTFGNGVESFKIRDSITGHFFNLGNRVTAVSAQDFKEADRYADITYSGVYNNESNVNKLNEFNLGLSNYKQCEQSFGPIEILFGRETDVLVLQEDKISYVLAGKNLLTDTTGESAVTSVPEVLGTQVARIEEFGISSNPESFVSYGGDKFFTDAKRGVVIKLTGSAGTNETLEVISNAGMIAWFRDLFNDYLNTQKVGGFDPYMNEYVLGSNTIALPTETYCLPCGLTIAQNTSDTYSFCVDVGQKVGDVVLTYTLNNECDIDIQYTYGATTITESNITSSGQITIDKDDPAIETIQVVITVNSGPADYTINTACPDANVLNVVTVVLTSPDEEGKTSHVEFYWTDGSYISPSDLTQIVFDGGNSMLISQYAVMSGSQGDGVLPINGSTVTMKSRRIGTDDFVFDSAVDRFYYLQSDTLYAETEADISTLINAASLATPITGSDPTFEASFTMGSGGEDYLYLVWDLRNRTAQVLCYDASSANDVCCDCASCAACTPFNATGAQASSALACAGVINTVYYHDGDGVYPEVGDTVYANNDCSINVLAGYFGLEDGNYILTNVSGVVTEKDSCSPA